MCGMRKSFLILAALAFAACGGEGANSTRAGYVALSADEAWRKLQREFPDAENYVRCAEINAPCAERSAYQREGQSSYWFALHDVAERCGQGETCAPDIFTYVEIEELGELIFHGVATVEYDSRGEVRQVIGQTRWTMPDLDQPKPFLLPQ